MIIDFENELSSDQGPIVATATSTDIYDLLSLKDVGVGAPVNLMARITQAFNNLTSLKVALEASVDQAFTVPVELVSYTALLAQLTLGKFIPLGAVPQGLGKYRYLRFKYTVTGAAPTTGKVTAAIMAAPLAKPANAAVTA